MATLSIDGRIIEAAEGRHLLEVCLDNGFYIPHLCHVPGMERPPSSCRLCFVAVEDMKDPAASCSLRVRDGMVVRTDTPEVRRLQRTAFELLTSNHYFEPGCCAAGSCELQAIVKFLKIPIKSKRLKKLARDIPEEDHPYLECVHTRCVLCGKCAYVCEKKQGRPYVSFARRGLDMRISFFGETDPDSIPCDGCYACVDICPVSAMLKKTDKKN